MPLRPGIGKTALILDCAGNAHELGLPDEVREWSLDDGEVNEDKAKKKHPRVCAKCYTAFYGRMCPNCLYSEPLGEVAGDRDGTGGSAAGAQTHTDTPEATQLRTGYGMARG